MGRRRLEVHAFDDARRFGAALARATGAPLRAVRVHRFPDGERRVRVVLPSLPAPRIPQRAVIVDDIASSGATLAATARALRRAGAVHVWVVVVHALFAAGALERIERAGVTRAVSCDTVMHPSNAIRVAPLVARALARRVGED